jgi:hypothetical protein
VIEARRLAVVLPAFRAGHRLVATVAAVPAWVDHIVVVDDGSDDGCAQRDRLAAAAAAGGAERLVVARLPWNRGVGAAIAEGYRQARRRGADIVVVMAGDGQMDPADLPALVVPLVDGSADYAKGNRLLHKSIDEMPGARRLGTTVLGTLTGWAIGEPTLSDSQCGYTAITGAMIDRLRLDRLWPRYGYPNDLLAMVKAEGGRIAEVVVRPVYAGEPSGLRPWHVLTIVGLIARASVRLRVQRVLGQSWPSPAGPGLGGAGSTASNDAAATDPAADAGGGGAGDGPGDRDGAGVGAEPLAPRSRANRSPIARSSP